MKSFALSLICFLLYFSLPVTAQTDAVPIFKGAIKANREKTYSNIVKNSITKNLSLPLTDSTEENWEDAFYAMEVINYKQSWVDDKIKTAFDSIEKRSEGFQRALMELLYTNYTFQFKSNVDKLFLTSLNAKVFAMCGEYLLRIDNSKNNRAKIIGIIQAKSNKYFKNDEKSSYIIAELYSSLNRLIEPKNRSAKPTVNLKALLNTSLKKGNTINTVVYSIQRRNRNYPGIVIVKDTNNNFVTDEEGKLFSVPQLARSITNLPGYLTNGNTPQGVFRMNGFGVSKSAAIGPTENIQLTMPWETSIQFFLKDSSITDTIWTSKLYQGVLPKQIRDYFPLLQAYYASAIGRTEIISHGTTVDPGYYRGETYYPFTPTQGCLCSKEIWSDKDGKRTISDQQKLVDAIKKAGGADGYLIVIEIDDQQKPVDISEVLPYLKNK